MNNKQILLINDMCGYGKVATAAMLPILSYMGHPVSNLPTALVSNTLEFNEFNILDTTEYIKGVFPVWRNLGFNYQAIATGFIVSEQQARIVSQYCREQAEAGTTIYVDPIMGDEGRLYNGVTPATIQSMREMVSVADLIFPNHTEACYLTNTPYHAGGMTLQQANELVDKLRQLGAKSVLITSIPVEGQHAVVGYNHINQTYFSLNYEEIPVRFPGTGDIFSAVIIGNLLHGQPLQYATQKAMDFVYKIIDSNKDMPEKNMGLPLEQHLNLL